MPTALSQLPYHSERIDGREVQKPLPKNLHAFLQTSLLIRLAEALPKVYRTATELNVICGDDRLIPDITVMRRNALFEDGDLADPPVLAVEILSPGQMIGDLFSKCDRLLRAGAGTCWVIWPERQQAWTYTFDLLTEVKGELLLELGETHKTLKMPLSALWAELL